MADTLARVGVLFVALAIVLPAEFSDSLTDGLTLLLAAYAVLLAFFTLTLLLGMNLLREGRENE